MRPFQRATGARFSLGSRGHSGDTRGAAFSSLPPDKTALIRDGGIDAHPHLAVWKLRHRLKIPVPKPRRALGIIALQDADRPRRPLNKRSLDQDPRP